MSTVGVCAGFCVENKSVTTRQHVYNIKKLADTVAEMLTRINTIKYYNF